MARESADRENLMREATALIERVALESGQLPDGFVAGFRRDGCLSLFFGANPVYQFNTRRQLRRAFVEACLVKAEDGNLVRLTREPVPGEIRLIRHELSEAEQRRLLVELNDNLALLTDAIDRNAFRILEQIPLGINLVARLRRALDEHQPVEIATSPHAR